MKIRTVKYMLREGASNVYKNKLMTLASVGIVGASLIIFGVFLLFVLNINHNTESLNEQVEMRVFCDYELSDALIASVEEQIKSNAYVSECRLISAADAFQNLKDSLGENANVLEGFDETLASASFVVKLRDPRTSPEAMEQFNQLSGVRKVTYFQEVIDFISKLTYWINLISLFLIAVLLTVSVFIIANTIKLTVFARRREIGIMKYIGATDWFIRWPFVVEGMLIGVIGAALAFLLTRYVYGTLEARFNRDLYAVSQDFLSLLKAGEVGMMLLGCLILLGAVVGAAGSLISLRKYLKV